jgi:hypothetical protein
MADLQDNTTPKAQSNQVANRYPYADRTLVDSIKLAQKELKDEEHHEKVHRHIKANLTRETPKGKVGMARCGLCDETFMFRPLELVSDLVATDPEATDDSLKSAPSRPTNKEQK